MEVFKSLRWLNISARYARSITSSLFSKCPAILLPWCLRNCSISLHISNTNNTVALDHGLAVSFLCGKEHCVAGADWECYTLSVSKCNGPLPPLFTVKCPVWREISDLCEISDLLLFVSYFPSQRKGIKFVDCVFDVCCVDENFFVRCQISMTSYSTGIAITTEKYWTYS